MSGPRATVLVITEPQRGLLQQIRQRQTACQRLVRRVLVLLALAGNSCVEAVAAQLHLSRRTVRLGRDRWNQAVPTLLKAEQDNASAEHLLTLIEEILDDDDRCGTPPTFTPEQIVQIVAVAGEPPEKSGRPISHWTNRALADEVIKRRIGAAIHPSTVGLFFKRGRLATASEPVLAQQQPGGPGSVPAPGGGGLRGL